MKQMEMDELVKDVRAQMPERRWQHTQGVVDTAVRLSLQYEVDVEKAKLAALLHDYCKYWPVEEQAKVLKQYPQLLPADLRDVLQFDKELWHAPAASILANQRFGITDDGILDAIRYHTTGRVGMSQLEKVICLADYMEPGREFPDVHKIRQMAEHSVEGALLLAFNSTIRFLIDRDKRVYPLSMLARNDLLQQ